MDESCPYCGVDREPLTQRYICGRAVAWPDSELPTAACAELRRREEWCERLTAELMQVTTKLVAPEIRKRLARHDTS